MNAIKYFLFVKFHVEANSMIIQKIESQKAEELLVYLLLFRDQPHSREQLADVLWGEIAPEQSRSYLRKTLWQLQSMLEFYGSQGMLLVEGEWIQVNLQFDFWLDVDEFEKAFNVTQGIRGKDLEEEQVKHIREAVELYRGELLEGWYQDWCLYKREHLQFLYLAMLDKLMDYYEARGDYENGLLLGEKILQLDRARERTHRKMMQMYYLLGDRTSALRQYQKCLLALKEELDVGPEISTCLFFERIQAKKNGSSKKHVEKIELNDIQEKDEALNTVFSHLNVFQETLNQMQVQISQDIRIIRSKIDNTW
jgi:DNA-binding SARP family transcriptional activator